MGLMNFIKGQLIDIIEWNEDARDVLSWRFPDEDKEIKNGAQLVVRESQVAQFIYLGQFGDVFSPGTHTLTTANIPILSSLKGWKYGFELPFKADVYYVSVRLFTGNRWSTANPVMMRDQDFGIVHLQAFGSYDFRIIVRNFFCGKSPVLTMNVVQRARSKPTAFQAVSFQQVGSDGCLEPAEHVGLAGPRVPPMKKLPLAGGAGATFSRARSLPPSGGSFFKHQCLAETEPTTST